MVYRTYSATTLGLDVHPIEIEVDSKQGIPQFILIGLPSRAIEEAKERITSALYNCGVRVRSKRTIVNLAPAAIPKTGTAFDLAIVVALLKMYGELRLQTDKTMFFGELSLDGKLKRVPGILPLVLGAKKLGFTHVVIPRGNSEEVHSLSGIRIFPIDQLQDLLSHPLAKELPLPELSPQTFWASVAPPSTPSFFSLLGQARAKRAAVLSAAGGHHLLLMGPPGTGKTQLAKSLPDILPSFTQEESIAATAVHSIAGLSDGLLKVRPFRSPHHSISRTALIGGGNPLKPGEISLAHHGVLFLDELLEFQPQLLDMLRQPLEDRSISLSFSATKTSFPCATTLVAAANPCPCGYYGSAAQSCHCSPRAVELYQQKLSGPLLDRFDLKVQMETERQLFTDATQLPSTHQVEGLRAQITRCRMRQFGRYHELGVYSSAQLSAEQAAHHIQLTPEAQKVLLRHTISDMVSGRGYFSILKISQTIADLEESDVVLAKHVQEAASFHSF